MPPQHARLCSNLLLGPTRGRIQDLNKHNSASLPKSDLIQQARSDAKQQRADKARRDRGTRPKRRWMMAPRQRARARNSESVGVSSCDHGVERCVTIEVLLPPTAGALSHLTTEVGHDASSRPEPEGDDERIVMPNFQAGRRPGRQEPSASREMHINCSFASLILWSGDRQPTKGRCMGLTGRAHSPPM